VKDSTTSNSFEYTISGGLGLEMGASINKFGITVNIEANYARASNSSSSTVSSHSQKVGFVLADGDQGDYYSVDVKKHESGNGPVFMTRGGQSSCPYEGEELTKYFRPGREVLNNATMRVEAPTLSVSNAVVSGVPENRPAIYTLRLGNDTEVGADAWYILTIDPTSNPNGAKLRLDGATIVNGIAVFVPANKILNKTLELWKGRADVNDYQNIRLILHSQCQFDPTDDVADIADTVSVSAHFIPACTEVNISAPGNNWLVNYAARDTLNIRIDGYDTQLSTFHKIDLQYKPLASSQWITLHSYFKDAELMNQSQDQSKSLIGQATHLNYVWSMVSLPDRTYQIRAKSVCLDGSIFESNPLTGILDGKRPQVFGTPQPADGILSAGEDISIRFDEPIEEGLLTSYNFSVKGVLNNRDLSHGASVSFDGQTDKMETGYGLQLSNRSYSIEFWLKNDKTAAGTLLSYLTENGEGLQVKLNQQKMDVLINDIWQKDIDISSENTWDHFAFVFDNADKTLSCYLNDKQISRFVAEGIKNEARLTLGAFANTNSFKGNIHDLRVWNKALLKSDIVSRMNTALSGYEIGLSGYWPMDEGYGNMIVDKASGRNANVNATWTVEPAGYSYQFNGVDQALVVNTGNIPMDNEMDMTIEFWFKAGDDAKSTVLMSNGNPVTDSVNNHRLVTIEFGETGNLIVRSNNKMMATPTSFTDNQWRHLALVVSRKGNASLYIDNNKLAEMKGQDFGAMMNSNTCFGALSNAAGTQRSKFFRGHLDEIRIWNTARSQSLLKSYKNTRISGTDAGLKAYFPFETYESMMGVMNTSTTYADLSVDEYSSVGASHCGSLNIIGNMNFSDIAPNIKRENPVTNVNFNFTVNNDQIIITPTDAPAMLEKSILEISVKGVEDRNGNRLASPVTWTAYVDKNTVKWTEEQIKIEKDANNAYTFKAYFKNYGGTAESYSIDNLPSWMSASPRTGIVGPDKTQEVSFTITPGLNVGSYSEDVYLHTSFGFDEKLNINLRVKGEEPAWTVNPALYGSSMSFISRLRINGLTSTDVYDKIGVFAGDECRGVAIVQYFESIDDYLVMLVVYGNQSNETLTYKVYDASTGSVYVDVTPQPAFSPEAILGDFASPVIFECSNTIRKQISLNKGWSWLSFNVDMNHYATFNEFAASVQPTQGDRFIHGSFIKQYEGSLIGWQGTMGVPENGKLYNAYVANGGTLDIRGVSVDPEKFPLTVVTGWNRIGYIPRINVEVNEALSAYPATTGDVIKGQLGFAMYNGKSWLGSLTYLEPDKGYMLKRNALNPTEFKYPKSSSYAKAKANVKSAVNHYDEFSIEPYNYENSFSVVARIDRMFAAPGSLLMVYIDNELRGVESVRDDYQFVSVFGHNADVNKKLRFILNDNGNITSLAGEAVFGGNAVAGDLENPVMLVPENTTGIDYLSIEKAVSIYPNPVSSVATVQVDLPVAAKVRVEVYNSVGQQIMILDPDMLEAGSHKLKLDMRKLPVGVYSVRTNIGNQVNILKVSKY
jgi:hypothetical protein